MSKVRINDLAREMEVKSRQILDVLAELGVARQDPLQFAGGGRSREGARAVWPWRPAGRTPCGRGFRGPQTLQPKIDLSHISKPGDALKAILAKKQEDEAAARRSHAPATPAALRPRRRLQPGLLPPVVAVAHPPAAPRTS